MSLRLVIIKEAVESWVGVCQRISVPPHTWGSEEDQPVLSPWQSALAGIDWAAAGLSNCLA
jgi:hypothetical protein